MCNIWQIQNPSELPVEWFANLNPELKYINLTGGEPFLHPRLAAIVRRVHQAAPKAQIIISSNGLATDLIVDTMKEIMKSGADIGVRISLDGIGETHDRIRGIQGMFKYALDTVSQLKALGIRNLGLSFTIQDENKDDLLKVYDLSRQMKVQLAMALVQNSEIYFSKDTNRVNAVEAVEKNLQEVIRRELAGPNPKHWLRAFYDYGLLLYLKEGKRLLPTGAGRDSLFIDPSGKIYPSNLLNLEMGNLGTGTLKDTWNKTEANTVREKIKLEKISESWIICTIRGEMKRHAIKVLWWVLKNKINY
jgi:MoaA/NifB/PqqE/SkfB family radical SAM enzyme